MKKKEKVIYSIQVGEEIFSYSLDIRTKVKNYSFKLDYDFIQVVAPKGATPEKAAVFLKKYSMILLAAIEKNRIIPIHRFVDGEIFLFLGEKYALNVIESSDTKVEILDDKLVLYTTDTHDTKLKANSIKNFFIDKARKLFPQFTETVCQKLGVKKPLVELYYAKSSFGKCHFYEDRIQLNYYLIFAPIKCIEYVIVHELAHFQVHNHQKKFWDIVSVSLPNHKELRKKLNEVCSHNYCNVVRKFFFNS